GKPPDAASAGRLFSSVAPAPWASPPGSPPPPGSGANRAPREGCKGSRDRARAARAACDLQTPRSGGSRAELAPGHAGTTTESTPRATVEPPPRPPGSADSARRRPWIGTGPNRTPPLLERNPAPLHG